LLQYYSTIHRYETNRLRNIARLFGHLLSSDAIAWHVLFIIHLNEEETTSSSRIFIKILFQDLAEALGMATLQARLKDDILRPSFEGIFPKDEPRNTRFSINYFTSIGMGGLTEEMREYLETAPKPAPIMPAPAESKPRSRSSSVSSSSSSYSSYTGSSRSYSRSRSPPRNGDTRRARGRPLSRSVTPPRRKEPHGRSISRSITPPQRNGYRRGRSPSPPRKNGRRSYFRSISRSPPRRKARSPSRSPPPRGAPPAGRRAKAKSASSSRSRSPPPRRRRARSYSSDRSRSPPPPPPPRRSR